MRRLPGFDALRFWMIVCVVCLHGAMSYMLYAPGYWYVKNPEGSGIFTMLVVLLDAFPMSALFFLSGYFALPSYNKKGCGEFLREKAMRVGLPWLLGTLLVAPFFAYASMLSLGLPLLGPGEFLGGFFWGAGYQQGV
jgi:fucose 4-O-acetylase-like acetyltransferase